MIFAPLAAGIAGKIIKDNDLFGQNAEGPRQPGQNEQAQYGMMGPGGAQWVERWRAQGKQGIGIDQSMRNRDDQLAAASRVTSGEGLSTLRNAARGDTEGLNYLRQAAQGNTPSQAQYLMQAGTDANIRGSMAMANSARGGANAQSAAQVAGIRAGEQAQAQQTNQMAALRANEIARAQEGFAAGQGQAQQAFASGAQNLYGQDIGARNASAAQAVAMAQANAENQRFYENLTHQAAMGQLNSGMAAQVAQTAANKQQGETDKAIFSGINQGISDAMAANANNAKTDTGGTGGGGGGNSAAAGGAMMAMMSDIRAKKDISPTYSAEDGRAIADGFLRSLSDGAASYEYKNGANEPRSSPTGGKYLGVMADNVQSAPVIGNQLVSEDKNGMKRIEGGAMQSALAGALGRVDERLRAVESGGDAQYGSMSPGSGNSDATTAVGGVPTGARDRQKEEQLQAAIAWANRELAATRRNGTSVRSGR